MSIQGVGFNFIDVAGGRNDRLKYAHLFEDVSAVLFVVAINEVCIRSFELFCWNDKTF